MSLAGERKSVAWCRSTELFYAASMAPTAGRALRAHGNQVSPPIEPVVLSEASLGADTVRAHVVLQESVEDSRDGVQQELLTEF